MGGAVLNGISAPNGVTVLTVIALLSTSVCFGSAAEVTPERLSDRASKEPADPCKAGECWDAALRLHQ